LFWLAGFAEKRRSVKWRLLYLLPFLVTLVLVAIYEFETCMFGVYLGAFLLVFGMVRQEKKVRCILCFVSVMFLVLSLGICLFSPAYRSYEYAEDFKAGFEEMKLHYVLSEQKDIDWDGLYEKYLPLFEEADKAHDEVAASIAWTQFAMEFQDGHVGYGIKDEKIEKMAYEKMYGNDYGLCTMKLSDGKIVAVMVEEDSQARKAGICNGSEITAWNGEPVAKLSGTKKFYLLQWKRMKNFMKLFPSQVWEVRRLRFVL
jgi:carboxyl-terminal processing protease